jgi:glycosidase
VFGRGLKRRLPTMLDGDPRRIRLAYSLMFSLPGTPSLYYGEEIGMGEDLEVEGRMAVRTPMQWSNTRNGGFSTAPPRRLKRRLVKGGYGPEHVNVEDQRRDPDSLWNFMRQLIQSYRSCPELGWGEYQLIDQPHEAVFAHCSEKDGGRVVTLHNLGAEPVSVPLTVASGAARLTDVLAGGVEQTDDGGALEIALDGYGFRWLRVQEQETRPG